MTAQLIRQANEISARASELRERAERLLADLREMNNMPARQEQGKTLLNGSRTLHILR